jgi:hypothetical protein
MGVIMRVMGLVVIVCVSEFIVSPVAAQIATLEELRREIPPVVVGANDSPLRKLLKVRFNTAVEETMALEAEYRRGKLMLEDLVTARSHLAKSGLELAENPAERVKQRELAFAAAKRIE